MYSILIANHNAHLREPLFQWVKDKWIMSFYAHLSSHTFQNLFIKPNKSRTLSHSVNKCWRDWISWHTLFPDYTILKLLSAFGLCSLDPIRSISCCSIPSKNIFFCTQTSHSMQVLPCCTPPNTINPPFTSWWYNWVILADNPFYQAILYMTYIFKNYSRLYHIH